MKSAVAGAVLLLLGFAAGTLAQEKDTASKEKKVRRVLELSGTTEMMKAQYAAMMDALVKMPNAPEGFAAKARELASAEELVDLEVPIYTKHFEEADLDGQIAFFESPAGKKVVQVAAKIQAESREAGEAWGRELTLKVEKALEAEKKK
jgi:hypothetical protein